MDDVRVVLVPAARWSRWVEGFERSHGPATTAVVDGALEGMAADGSTYVVRLPFGRRLDEAGETGPPDGDLTALVAPPAAWGVLLVRRGGFAMARLAGERLEASKVGRRHVQGRTKAGGQSQQRFARRRDNQARVAWEAAAGHAAAVLDGAALLVAGGDRAGVEAVLEDPRLRGRRVVEPWLAVPDPTRAVLDQAVADAGALQVRVRNR